MKAIYETAAETAKKIRKELKKNFPGIKFYVKSKSYTGGSSIRITWENGPSEYDVNAIAQNFKSAKFDGMTDMKTYTGYEYEGQLYQGADYIFCKRL